MFNDNRDKYALEVDHDAAKKRISHREWISLLILLFMFAIVFPAKYHHQIEGVWKLIKAAKDGDDE